MSGLVFLGGMALIVAAWMGVGVVSYIRAGQTWAIEVPIMLTVIMTVFGGIMLAGGFGLWGGP